MARRKKARLKEQKGLPDWAKAIQELREVLGGGTQKELAARLRSKQCTVSTWLRGDETRKPSADSLIRMAGLAPNPDLASRFLRLANISDEAIFSVARKLQTDRFREAAPLIEKGDIVLVDRVRETLQGREIAGPKVPLPKEFAPNPDSTICLIADEKSDGMIDAPRGLFLVDTSIEGLDCVKELVPHVVVIYLDREGFSRERYRSPGNVPRGVYIGRMVVERSVRKDEQGPRLIHEWTLYSLFFRERSNIVHLGSTSVPLPFDIPGYPPLGTDWDDYFASMCLRDHPEQWREYVEIRDELLSKFRLPADTKVLGRVIGRLSGNVK